MTMKSSSMSSDNVEPLAILITGGCGYIGAALTHAIANDRYFSNATIRILDNMQGGGYSFLMSLPEGMQVQFIEGDIMDPVTIRQALQEVEVVIHLAAIVRTPINFDHPNWCKQVNHWGTVRLMEEARSSGVKVFIFTSTAAVYGSGGPYGETDPCRPLGHYAITKYNAEKGIRGFGESTIQPIILRLGTVFGYSPTMRFDALPNRFVYQASHGQSLAIHGDGMQKRPIIHVADAAEAILHVVKKRNELQNTTFNVVGENPTILEMVEAIRTVKPEIPIRFTDQDALTHISFEVQSTRIAETGFTPRVSLTNGIADLMSRFQGVVPVPLDDDLLNQLS
jgi:UDP-glucose 4-epimerase